MGVARKGQSGGYSQQIEKTRFQNKSGTRQWPYHCVIRCTFWDFWNSFFFVTLSLLNLAESFFFFGKSGIASNEGRRSTMTIL